MPCDLDSPPSAPLIPDLLDSQSILGGGLVQRRDGAARMAADASLGSLPVLSTQADWPSWLQQIEALARLSGIWDYVDPDGGQHLEEPARPVAPATPSFDSWTQRQMAETDEECQARFAEHKLQLDLIGRTFDIHHERYRIECHEYSIKLAEHAAARDEMGQLNRIIYAGVDKHWRAHLVGDMAATPRLKLKILASLMAGAGAPPQPPPASASPPPSSSHFAQLMDKLRCQGPRDWTLWACSVANLAEKCDELARSPQKEQMANEAFLESVQPHYEAFYQRWNKKMSEAICNGDQPASFQKLAEDFVQAQVRSVVAADFSRLGCHLREDRPGPQRRPDRADRADSQRRPDRSDRADSQRRSDRTDSYGKAQRVDAHKRADRADSPTLSAQSTQATQAKARGKCPGCQLVHRMKGDSWWQTCWVFDAYMGRDTSPSWFISRDDRIECVRERLTANPKEEKQAIAWDSRR